MATANHDVIGTEEAIAPEEFTRGYRAWMLFILLLMNALNLADRQGLAAVAPTLTIAQNMVDASMRASSSFTVAVVFGLIGIGLGPTLLGIISDLAANRYFGAGNFLVQCPGGAARPGAEVALSSACSTASAHGVQFAMAAVAGLLLWGSLHYLLAARTLRADLDARYRARPADVVA